MRVPRCRGRPACSSKQKNNYRPPQKNTDPPRRQIANTSLWASPPPNPDAFVDQVLRGQPSGARAMTASFPKQLFCVTSFPKTVTKTFVQLTRSEHTHRARVQCATSWSMRSWKKTTTGRFILLDHGAQSPGPSTGNGTATSFICFLLLCGWLFGWLVAGCLGGVGGSLGLARPSPHPPTHPPPPRPKDVENAPKGVKRRRKCAKMRRTCAKRRRICAKRRQNA